MEGKDRAPETLHGENRGIFPRYGRTRGEFTVSLFVRAHRNAPVDQSLIRSDECVWTQVRNPFNLGRFCVTILPELLLFYERNESEGYFWTSSRKSIAYPCALCACVFRGVSACECVFFKERGRQLRCAVWWTAIGESATEAQSITARRRRNPPGSAPRAQGNTRHLCSF